jgi:ABC-type polysaccharide/polyol phosphate transport system ATPase subunit
LPDCFNEGLGELGQPLAVITLVVEHSDFFHLEDIEGKIDLGARLGIIGGNGPEKIGDIRRFGSAGVVAEGEMTRTLAAR